MAFSATVYRVLIASPGDVREERLAVQEAIHWWNSTHSRAQEVLLQAVLWEMDATPEMGSDPQQIINRQIVSGSDILIGIFWSRLGTPTPRAESGTLEEIQEFVASGKPASIYFSKKDIPQTQLNDLSQFTRLQEFKATCQRNSVYGEFNTVDGLSNLVQNHISRTVLRLKSNSNSLGSIEAASTVQPNVIQPVLDRLEAEADVLKDRVNASVGQELMKPSIESVDDDVGFLDLSEMAVEAMHRVTKETVEIRVAIENIGSQMQSHSQRIDAAVAAGQTSDPSNSKKLVNAAASDLDTFGSTLLLKSAAMGKEYALFIDAIRRLLQLASEAGTSETDRKELSELMGVTSSFSAQIDGIRQSMRSFRSTVMSLPRMTGSLNRAKRLAGHALDELDKQLSDIGRLTDDLDVALADFTRQQGALPLMGSESLIEPKERSIPMLSVQSAPLDENRE